MRNGTRLPGWTRGKRHLLAVVLGIVAITLVVGGGSAGPTTSEPHQDSGGADPAITAGVGLSVAEAIDATSDQPIKVAGYILASADEVRFCSALAESIPPQCVGESLTLEGLDLATIATRSAAGVTWSDLPVRLVGEMHGSMLHVSRVV